MDMFLALTGLSAVSPDHLAGLLAKGTLICVVGLFLCSEFSLMAAAIRHRIVLGTLFCLVTLPVLSWALTPWELEVLPRASAHEFFSPTRVASLLMVVYLGVAIFLLARLCLDLARVVFLSRRAKAVESGIYPNTRDHHPCPGACIAVSDEVGAPMTWGWLKPVVLLPRGATAWSEEDLSMVLRHEAAHIDRADWLVLVLGRCIHALYWPVPGIRQLLRQLSLSSEQACDDRVLASGVSPARYAAMLLRLARGNSLPATVSLGSDSELRTRIRYMVVEFSDHSVLARGAVSTFVLGVLLTAPLAAMTLGHRPDVPVMPLSIWGALDAPLQTPSSIAPRDWRQQLPFGEAAAQALRPGPERPARPPLVETPPRLGWPQKPTIPPP